MEERESEVYIILCPSQLACVAGAYVREGVGGGVF